MKFILTLIFTSIITIMGFAQTITVNGTGCFLFGFITIDGTYTFSGTLNGKNDYVHSNLQTRISWDGSQWTIAFGGAIGYTNPNDVGISPPDLGWVNGGGCSSQPLPTLTGDVLPLPVELISFKGEIIRETIILNWKTASELNNEKFEIERSSDGQVFQKIGEVRGGGTTIEHQNYSFEVKNPRNGTSYYRLKQMDFDGQFEYSEVISVNFKGENGDVGEFYPNPSNSGLVNLEYFAQNDDEITVSVFDMTGKLVVNQIKPISNGNNKLSFNFLELNSGIYIAKIGNERYPTHRKLIIER